MARTVRNPMETRTPVRTISSVMRNAPRQQFQPRALDIGFDRQGGGRDDFGGFGGYGGQQRTPINQAVTSVLQPTGGRAGTAVAPSTRPAGGQTTAGTFVPSAPQVGGGTQATNRPANRPAGSITSPATRPAAPSGTATKPATQAKAPTTSVVKPVAPKTTPTKTAATVKPASSTVKTTPKTTTTGKTTTAVKPITSTTTKAPTSPVKPVTSTTTKTPTTKTPVAPVKPITTPTTKTPTSPVKPITSTTGTTKPTTTTKPSTGSSLTSTLLKTAAGAGAGALLNKVLNSGKTTTGGTTTTKPGGTTVTKPAGIPTTGTKTTGTTTKPAGIPTGGTTKPTAKATPAAGATAKKAADTAAKKTEIAAANPEMTEEEIQAELDRAKAEETFDGPPEDAVVAEDGTYTVTDADGNISTYSASGELIGYEGPEATALTEGSGTEDTVTGGEATPDGVTRSLTGGVTADLTGDTSTMTDLGEGYFQDDEGNIYGASGDLMYAVGENGEYYDPNGELIYDPNADETTADATTWVDPDTGEVWNLAEDGTWSSENEDTSTDDTFLADNTWTDPDTGEVWNMADDGSWSLEGEDVAYDDTTYDSEDYTVASNEDDTDYSYDDEEPPEAKRGGSIHRKTKGGLPRFADGDTVDYSDTEEEIQPWQNVDYNFGEFDDPTMTGYTLTGNRNPVGNTYLRSAALDEADITNDFTPTPGIQYFDDGSYIQTFDDGSTITVDSDGNVAGSTDGYQTTVDDEGNTTVTDGYGNMTVYDPNGNVIPVGGGRITSAGSGNRQSYEAAVAAANRAQQQQQPNQTGVLDALKGYITDNPGLAGGAIGALLASLMNQSGDSAGPSQPVDISALTAFAPRTTDFGPGMTGGRTGTGSPIVSYQDYAEGYGDETPDERLYSDLGISGWLNEPEMTDYTDEDGAPVDQYGNYLNDNETPEEDMAEVDEEPAMAAGGPTTHYTFGRVINPAENLGLAQGMKKGGLSQAHTVHSHHTNPVINERVDFRKGSAVNGAGDGQSDDIPAWLADGEYVMDAELVSMLGNGSNKAGAKVLDKFREEIRAHKRGAPLGKIPPKAKSPLNYLKEAMNG